VAVAEEDDHKCPEGRVEWIYTYGDMVTLLLCFFVLLFAMSKTEEEKFRAVAASFKGPPESSSPFMFKGAPSFMESIEAMLKKSDISEVTDITVDDRGITVSFSDTAMFKPGKAEPTKEGVRVIEKFSGLLHALSNSVIIEGHTDDVPIKSEIYPSNWELSGARSGSVARHLEQFGIPSRRIEIAAYGSTRPKVANENLELRSLNRRIDILIKPDGY